MNIGFCYNVRHTKASKSLTAQEEAEFDSPQTIADIKKALEKAGHRVYSVEADENAYSKLRELKERIKIVFNIAEGLGGQSREAQIPALLEMLKIPYTHSGVLPQAVTLDKTLTKQIISFHGINTPNFQLFYTDTTPLDPALNFPLLVKPNCEGSSKGIFTENLVFDVTKLKGRIKWLLDNFQEPVLVEEFLNGREFTVSLLGNNPPHVLPIVEQNYQVFPENMPHFASYEAKWLFEDNLPNPHDAYFCPAPLEDKLRKKIENMCLSVWAALDLKDVARMDIRLDKSGEPSFLEVNTMPGLISDPNIVSYFPIAARIAGYDFDGMVRAILNAALKRHGIKNMEDFSTSQTKPLQLSKDR